MENFLLRSSSSRLPALLLLTLLFTGIALRAQPLLTESFNHPPGTLLTLANWTQRASGTPAISVGSGNLDLPSAIANNFGNKVGLTSSGQDVYRGFSTSSATTYNSMVVRVSAAQLLGDYFYIFGNATSPVTYGAKIHIRSNGAGFSFDVSRGASTTPVMNPSLETLIQITSLY